MKSPYNRSNQQLRALAITGVFSAFFVLFPDLLLASENAAAQFMVSAWLVRIWLAMVCATAIVVGVMLAMDSYSANHTLDPELTADNQVVLVKKQKLSYRKIGGGLLCVLVGSALFVTTVFLLPDKRTGRSGIDTIRQHFNGVQSTLASGLSEDQPGSPTQHH